MKQVPKPTVSKNKLLLAGVFFLVFGLIFSLSALAQGEEDNILTGSWDNDLYFYPDETGEDFLSYSSQLSLTYRFSSFSLGSTTSFGGTNGSGLSKQSFNVDGRLGVFDISSDVVFDPENNRLDYWLSEGSLTFAGATLKSVFLLEYHVYELVPGIGYVDYPGEYGAGIEFSVSGDMPGGGSAEISSLFGMEEDEYEILGLQSGSGYDITQWGPEGKFSFGTSSLHYVSTTVEFFGLDLGCCSFDTETKFSARSGFEYTEFDFTIDSTNLPVSFDTTMRFTPQTKSVTLDPYIEISGDCFTTYFDLVEGDPSTFQLELEGFGLDVKLGNVTFSSVTALKGNLFKARGASHLVLRADDYIIDPNEPQLYEPTPYDEIASISLSPDDTTSYPNHSFGADLYFNMSGEDGLFDISLVTIDLTTRLSPQLELGTGASITPEGDIEALLEIDVSF